MSSSRETGAGPADPSVVRVRRRVLVRRRLFGATHPNGRWLVRAARRGYLRIFLVSAAVFAVMAVALYFALRQA